MINKLELVKGFDDYVKSHDWDIFFSTTFRKLTKTITIIQDKQPKEVRVWLNGIPSMRKELQYFFSHLNYVVNFVDKYMLALICFERQYKGAPIHIHALIKGISPQFCRILKSESYEFFGESEVKPYDSTKPVSFYFGWKYLKSELVDFDFLRINSRRRKKPKRRWEVIV